MSSRKLAIRDLRPSDAEHLARWQRDLYRYMGELNPQRHRVRATLSDLRKDTRASLAMLKGMGGFGLIAELSGRPVGFLLAQLLPAVPHHFRLLLRPELAGQIDPLFVEARSRNRGIGTALCLEAERRLREAGCDTLTLGVVAENQGAARLYASLGYRTTGVRMHKRVGPSPKSWTDVENRHGRAFARLGGGRAS